LADVGGEAHGVAEVSEVDGGAGWIVPDDAVAFICNYERHIYTLTADCVVVVGAAKDVAAAVDEAFLVLAEAVKVLVLSGREGCADLIERVVGGPAIVQDAGVAVLVIRD
jgi:hypothetical protein